VAQVDDASQVAVGAALDRVRAVDPWLRAMLHVEHGRALAAARHRDAHPGGALWGLPIVVKGRNGMRSEQTRRLVAAGAVPIGTTSTPRGPGHQTWGHTERGPTRNPWRGDLSPGGSSAGSAAAVAAGITVLGIGSDGAGSVRIPAAWCGVYGFKPTTAVARRAGHADPSGLAVPGPLTRDPALLSAWAAAVLGALAPAPRFRSITWSPGLGYADDLLDAEVVAIAHRAARRTAAAAGLAWRPSTVRLLDPRDAWALRRDQTAASPARRAAAAVEAHNAAALAALLGGVDALATPTTPGPPHGHDGPGDHLSVALTWAFNLSGHPAATVPAGCTRAGAPVGLHLVSGHHTDAALLELLAGCAPVGPVTPRA
jgi:Asp-tRNA(Asn)/Glu-tRNA(Gln) amidotransferase A subunit family amidase